MIARKKTAISPAIQSVALQCNLCKEQGTLALLFTCIVMIDRHQHCCTSNDYHDHDQVLYEKAASSNVYQPTAVIIVPDYTLVLLLLSTCKLQMCLLSITVASNPHQILIAAAGESANPTRV